MDQTCVSTWYLWFLTVWAFVAGIGVSHLVILGIKKWM